MRRIFIIMTLLVLLNSVIVYAKEQDEGTVTEYENHESDFNGYKVVDADELGSFIVESKKNSYNTAQLNFACTIPDGFNLGVILELENETEGLKFRLISTHSNEYVSRLFVPPGNYRVLNCYVEGDTKLQYPMQMPDDFVIRDSESYTVNSTLINYDEIKEEATIRLSDENSEPDYTSIVSPNKEEEEKIPFWRQVTKKGEGSANIKLSGICKYSIDFIVRITATGGDRKGEYTYSTDGGDTWSEVSIIKTASDQPIYLTNDSQKETGLKLRFDSMAEYLKYDEYYYKGSIEYKIEEIGNVGKAQIQLYSDEVVYNDSYKFIMKVTKTGGLGRGGFEYSLDNGLTWSRGTPIPKDGVYSIPKTILKIGFFDGNGDFMVSDSYKAEVKGDMSKRDYTPYLAGFIGIISVLVYMLINHYRKMKDDPRNFKLHVYEPVIIDRKKKMRR